MSFRLLNGGGCRDAVTRSVSSLVRIREDVYPEGSYSPTEDTPFCIVESDRISLGDLTSLGVPVLQRVNGCEKINRKTNGGKNPVCR